MVPAFGNDNRNAPSKLPILIVAYCRANRIKNLLELLQNDGRKVYVAIDKAPPEFAKENEEVKACVEGFREKLPLTIKINEVQAGVKLGVPRAVDWVLSLEEACIVIEDDCVPTIDSLEFFDEMTNCLVDNVVIVSGDSPWETNECKDLTLSSFPLIWGWSTNRNQWKKVNGYIETQAAWAEVLFELIRSPSKMIPLAYFFAAHIRVRKGQLQAWDCSIALRMLVKDLKCLVPNIRLINNLGNDEYAHHTKTEKEVIRGFDEELDFISKRLNKSPEASRITDKIIKGRIYNMSTRHLLSPLKALILK